MKKLIIQVLFLILILPSVQAQTMKWSFQIGYGSSDMSDLKAYDYRIANLPKLEPKQIENYPSYLYYQGSVSACLDKLDLGFSYSYHSTGARYSLIDYSGSYLYDSRISYNGPAILAEHTLNPQKRFQFALYGELGLLFTKLVLDETLEAGGEMLIEESSTFHGVGGFLEPGMKAGYSVGIVKVFLNLGYMLPLGKGELSLDTDRTYQLTSTETVKPDWRGYRLGIGVSVNLASSDTTE